MNVSLLEHYYELIEEIERNNKNKESQGQREPEGVEQLSALEERHGREGVQESPVGATRPRASGRRAAAGECEPLRVAVRSSVQPLRDGQGVRESGEESRPGRARGERQAQHVRVLARLVRARREARSPLCQALRRDANLRQAHTGALRRPQCARGHELAAAQAAREAHPGRHLPTRRLPREAHQSARTSPRSVSAHTLDKLFT